METLNHKAGTQHSASHHCFMRLVSNVLLSGLMVTSLAWSQGVPPAGAAAPPGAGQPGPPPPGQGGPGGPGPGQTVAPEVDHSKECDSACLRKHADKYMAAYAKHDPSTLEVNPTFRASENSHAVALGDNTWNQVRRILPEKVVLTDPFAGQVLVLGVLEMRGPESFIYSVRLKIENNKISESEIQAVSERTGGVHFRPDLMGKSYELLDSTLPAAQRMTRTDLLKAARISWGLDSGTQPARATSCFHYENWESPDGGSGCRGAGRNPRNIRVPLVDVEKGVVVSYLLEDFTSPQPGAGPPSEANLKLPVFYIEPMTFYIMKTAKFTGGQFAMDAMFMSTQEYGATTVFRK